MQYGQRKLQRSMTEMRRSWMGRRNASSGGLPMAESGTIFSRGSMASPTIETRHEALRVRVRTGRQFDETLRARKGREITRAIRGAGFGRRAAPVIVLESYRQVIGQGRLDLHGC